MVRIHANDLAPDETEMWFVQDLPKGQIEVMCLLCKAHSITGPYDPNGKIEEKCPHCGKYIVYRPWLEW